MNRTTITNKIALAYIILIVTSALSVGYIINQFENISSPDNQLKKDTSKIVVFSKLITNIFDSEAISRIAMISCKTNDVERYNKSLNLVFTRIDSLKSSIYTSSISSKLDTIKILLTEKENSILKIIELRTILHQNLNFNNAVKRIKKTDFNLLFKNSAQKNATENSLKENATKIKKNIIEKSQTILNDALNEDQLMIQQLINHEELLNEETQEITEQIRLVIKKAEEIIFQNSYKSIQASKEISEQTSRNLLLVGSISFLITFILGLIVIRDLNRTFKYKKKLEELNNHNEQLIKQKKFFFAALTHDLVSPLNILVGFTSLLKRTLVHKKQQEYISNIESSTLYLQNLVNDFIDFTKLEHNKITIQKQSFHFGKLIRNLESIYKIEAEKKHIEFTSELDSTLDIFICSDAQRINQILINLITNAIKFTHQGIVSLKAEQQNDILKITVSDTGIGIDEKFHKNIFSEFKQAHSGIEKVYGGTGLGLNITKRLVDLLFGKIYFTSSLGKGTSFVVELPLKLAEENIENTNKIIYSSDKKISEKRILVIDDDKLQLKLLEELFKDTVREIITLNQGEKVLQTLKENAIDLVFTDIQMPHYTGYDIIKDIRSHKEFDSIAVVAFTGKKDLEENEYYNLGFNALVQKPIQVEKLLKTTYKLLEINFDAVSFVAEETASKFNIKNSSFDISDILQFTENDQHATQKILQLFIENNKVAIVEMRQFIEDKNWEKLKNLAHRMLPMFRQLKMTNQIQFLEYLEQNIERVKNDTIILESFNAFETNSIKVFNEIQIKVFE